ncbi:sugar ABC transporter ATP-binding protein [Limibacillus halophilus]|uniref:Ribose transport system ATP-binding protein n=1 Tax=Limibacillus halophilus TaxID=1579333 RepID=A0A839SRC1_9PROT|nr:sugar ABC transporter ATP-binding protein [Limibacillus halophilus]MBB3064509.1 ribose transport system ATP-binding protein [Limibacillus halophilus]
MLSKQKTEPDAFADANGSSPPLLEARNLSKSYSGFMALDSMNFSLRAGEVHVLFGENGAGKTTLVNILCGANQPTRGEILLDGLPVTMHSVRDAHDKGIASVFQEFSLAPDLTVEDNLFLGSELTRYGTLKKSLMRRQAREIIESLGFALDTKAIISDLSRAECQMVEIAKATMTKPRVLILDEPTASLTKTETDILFALINRLRGEGVGIVYITHRIEEIQKIGDRVTVMRDGQFIETLDARIATKTELVESMTGRSFGSFYPNLDFTPGDTVLAIDQLATRDGHVANISLMVRAGEIVGLAGLVGCGKSEIGRACFGLEPLASGTIHFAGKHVKAPQPREMIASGMNFVPSDRMRDGLMLSRSTRENLSLSALNTEAFTRRGFLRLGEEKRFAQDMGTRIGIRPLRVEGAVSDYSGGNKQKVMLGRAIASPLRLLILDEPTIGIDVSAKTEVYALLAALVKEGMAILMISSDLPEVLSMSNRVYVVRQGHLAGELSGARKTEDEALQNFFGN